MSCSGPDGPGGRGLPPLWTDGRREEAHRGGVFPWGVACPLLHLDPGRWSQPACQTVGHTPFSHPRPHPLTTINPLVHEKTCTVHPAGIRIKINY